MASGASGAARRSAHADMELALASNNPDRSYSRMIQQYQEDRNKIDLQQKNLYLLKSQLMMMQPVVTYGSQLRVEMQRLWHSVQRQHNSQRRLIRCEFNYQLPEPDHHQVYGLVCKLIKLLHPSCAAAIETTAGERLFDVVVDTVFTRMVLRRSLLYYKSIIPLDAIAPEVMDLEIVRIAQEIGGGPRRVQLALDLITFPEAVRPAMELVFGNTLVCHDLATAKCVSMHPSVRRRCVTLRGEKVNASGIAVRTFRKQRWTVLRYLAKQRARERRLAETEARAAECTRRASAIQPELDMYNDMLQRVNLMAAELERLQGTYVETRY